MPVKLTTKIIEALEPPAKLFDSHRDAPRGFGVRARKHSTEFVLRYRLNGIERLATIGAYPTWSLTAARDRARELRRIVDAGGDPVLERRLERGAMTVKDAFEDHFRDHARTLKSADEVRHIWERHLLPALGKRKLHSIRRADVIPVITKAARTAPRSAAKALRFIKGLTAWATDREILELDPLAGLRPVRVHAALKGGGARARARVLSDSEIKAFWSKVETTGMSKQAALALKLILVTAQRPGEVAGMQWGEIEGDVWTIPASRRKTGGEHGDHEVPLTRPALEILEAARAEAERLSKRRRRKPGDSVFESHTGRPIGSLALARAVTRHEDDLDMEADPTWGGWRPHDLRRTARTRMGAAGIPEEIGERVIGHVRGAMVERYDRHRYLEEKRLALETWANRLEAIIEGESEAKVIPITRKQKAK